jgi:uncharacterized protein with ParB-like and HNH nuclease domain
MNFNTTNQTFRQLFGNGLSYFVPQFQRDYSWEADHWDDLWQDIMGLFADDPEPYHYMGYLVLQSIDNNQFNIIDGQQRLTTFSIMILAALANLSDIEQRDPIEAKNNRLRRKQLRNSYIGYLDPVTLIPRSKLTLNKHNNQFYQNYLVPLEKIPQAGLNSSEQLLRASFYWFKDQIKIYCQYNGEKIAKFIDTLVDKLFFNVIIVTDELNAFKVFETLNARGVRLSSTDLLKNYLFSVVSKENTHETEIQHLESRWETIVGNLGAENFSEFLRVFWNSRHKLVRKTELFKTICKSIQNKAEVFALMRDLDIQSRIYAALINASDELWEKEERRYLQQLQIFKLRQPLALLIAAYSSVEQDKRDFFLFVLRSVYIISFRYNLICNKLTNEQEKVYNEAAIYLTQQKHYDKKQLVQILAKIYPEDKEFKASFANKILKTTDNRNKRLARHILFELEKHCTNKDFDIENSEYTIEHILPEHPEENWSFYDEHNDKQYIYRLGNMTLLEAKLNRKLGNASYDSKIKAYKNSNFSITSGIAKRYDEWNNNKITSRQEWMAQQAVSIWKLY